MRLMQLDASSAAVHADEVVDVGNIPALRGQQEERAQEGTVWQPLQLLLGLPLAPQALCADVCRSGSGCLMEHNVSLHQLVTGLHPLQRHCHWLEGLFHGTGVLLGCGQGQADFEQEQLCAKC